MKFLKRIYTVMEVRTGFATGLPILSAGIFGGYLNDKINITLLILMFISGFSFNIACNVASEIKGHIKKEDENDLTGHKGSEGLSRGDASIRDAIIALILSFGLGSISGLLIVFITKDIIILIIGIVSAIFALAYSIGPIPYYKYPVGEFISGTFVGCISSVVSAYLQLGEINVGIILYGGIAFIMTVFLMSTNNTSDYNKDMGRRISLPHVIGFRNSIKLILPEAIFMMGCFIMLYVLNYIDVLILMAGIIVFYYSWYIRWYKDYYIIKMPYKEMSKEFGARPLILIYSYNITMMIMFLVRI